MGATIVNGSQVDLTWNDVSTSVSGYSIQQLMADGVTWQEVQTAGANASSAVVIGNFDPPGQYMFQVVAYQEMDEPDDTYELDSQASNQATITALAWPSSPTGLTTTPVSNSEIDLAWTESVRVRHMRERGWLGGGLKGPRWGQRLRACFAGAGLEPGFGTPTTLGLEGHLSICGAILTHGLRMRQGPTVWQKFGQVRRTGFEVHRMVLLGIGQSA